MACLVFLSLMQFSPRDADVRCFLIHTSQAAPGAAADGEKQVYGAREATVQPATPPPPARSPAPRARFFDINRFSAPAMHIP
jgi:hypothetical protein